MIKQSKAKSKLNEMSKSKKQTGKLIRMQMKACRRKNEGCEGAMALAECNVRTNRQGRELVEHGTALFPVACYYNNLAEDSVAWHWHDELEVIVMEEGEAIVAAGTEKYHLRKGEGIFINAGVLHAAWNGRDAARFHSIVFHPRLVGGSIDSIFWQNYIQPLITDTSLKSTCFDTQTNWHQEAAGAIEEAWQTCVAEPPGYEFQVRNALSKLIFLVSGHHPAVKCSRGLTEKSLREGERIKTMLQYIQEHYSEEINTAMIAQSAMISESECLRCFRGTIGTPPIQYLKQFRIQKAAELLNAADMKIADVGAQCGFQDISYFTKTFRELKGCTPTEYRRQGTGIFRI